MQLLTTMVNSWQLWCPGPQSSAAFPMGIPIPNHLLPAPHPPLAPPEPRIWTGSLPRPLKLHSARYQPRPLRLTHRPPLLDAHLWPAPSSRVPAHTQADPHHQLPLLCTCLWEDAAALGEHTTCLMGPHLAQTLATGSVPHHCVFAASPCHYTCTCSRPPQPDVCMPQAPSHHCFLTRSAGLPSQMCACLKLPVIPASCPDQWASPARCVHSSSSRPSLLSALIPRCWTWRCCWGTHQPLQTLQDPPHPVLVRSHTVDAVTIHDLSQWHSIPPTQTHACTWRPVPLGLGHSMFQHIPT